MIWAWWGCGPDVPSTTCTPDTWTSFAQPLTRTWCGSCHHTDLQGDARHGAPEGVDFDTLDGVAAWADDIVARATGPSPTMPPVGGPTPDERERLAAWVACGLPGESTAVPAPCEAPAVVDAFDATCPGDQHVTGDVALPGGTDCLCAVDGGLTVSGDVEAPWLTAVGGDLHVTGGTRVSLPALEVVGGSVRADGVNGLDELLLGELSTVGDALSVTSGGPRILDLSNLETVTGDVHLVALPELQDLRLTTSVDWIGGDLVMDGLWAATSTDGFGRLVTVGGDLLLRDVPLATEVFGLQALVNVGGHARFEGFASAVRMGVAPDLVSTGGDLVFADAPDVPEIESLALLASVGGSLAFERFGALPELPAMPLLVSLGGFRLVDDDALEKTARFDALVTVSGDVVWQRLPALATMGRWKAVGAVGGRVVAEDLPQLGEFADMPAATSARGLELRRTGALHLGAFGDLTLVEGDLVVEDLDVLIDLTGMDEVVTITGSLRLLGNDALADLSQAVALVTVGGDVEVSGNASLPQAAAEAFVQGIAEVGGSRVAEGNGP